jgi:hypothetical protein
VGRKRVNARLRRARGVARRKAREPCPRAASLDRVGMARRGTGALAPLPTLRHASDAVMLGSSSATPQGTCGRPHRPPLGRFSARL